MSFAQVTTSSMSGKITDINGEAVEGITVLAVYIPSGTQYYSITDNNGYYRIQNMKPGGPYSVEVSLLGYCKNVQKGATLALAENYVHNVILQEESISIDEIVVMADAVKNTGATLDACASILVEELGCRVSIAPLAYVE